MQILDTEPVCERDGVERSMNLCVVVEVHEHLALAHGCRRAERAAVGRRAPHLPGAHARGPTVECRVPVATDVQLLVCLLYTSDAADDLTRVDLGGRRI